MADYSSVTTIEKEAKKLKRDLESWREVILPIKSVLLWEENSYIGVIIATTSIGFFLLWQMNPSILSLLSFLGILVTLTDFLVPTLTPHFCHPEKWTSTKERQLESVCKSLAAYKLYSISLIKSFYQLKTDCPKSYYTIVISTLIFLFWIGNTVNNWFLTYLMVTSLLLIPGLQQRGLIKKYSKYLYNLTIDEVESIKNE